MRSDWVISASGHAVLILLGLVSLASSKPSDDLSNLVPVTIVTDADISRAALGQKNAPSPADVKPLADKIGDPKPVKELAPKVADKPEITTNATPPKPEPKPEPQPQPKPQPKAQLKPDPKTAEKHDKKPADFKPDQIADLLNKNDAQKPSKPQDKATPETPKYDANQIAELLDHREPQRQVATAAAVNSTPNLGASTAAPNAQLSQSEIDAFRERIRECWSPPPGVDADTNVYVALRVLFKPDGSLVQAPVLVAGSASALGPALAESGKRALLQCQPFTMLKPEHYTQWKDVTVNFSPHDMSN